MPGKALDFFLGSLSPTGFHNYFKNAYPQLEQGTVLLLKSGPGCGKSRLLSQISQKLLNSGETIERIHCSADPSCLDGILCPHLHFAAFDATGPHNLEPDYPLAFERIVPFYSFLDSNILSKQRARIAELSDTNRHASERAARYLSAAACLLKDTERSALCCTDVEKVQRFARTLSHRYFPHPGQGAQEDIRLLSAITPNGIVFFDQTISKLAKNIIVLDDPYGAVGRILMKELRKNALELKHSVITCHCPLDPPDKIDHIILPKQQVAFVLSSSYFPLQFTEQRTIHATRFMNHEGLVARKKRIRFNQKASRDLLAQATKLYKEAEQARTSLKDCYGFACREKEQKQELSRLEDAILSSL